MKMMHLCFCLTLLFSNHAVSREVSDVKVEVLAKSCTSWDGQNLPAYAQGTPEITILKITIPPMVQLPLHKHPVINAGVLTKGELTVICDDGKTLQLKAGDSIVEVVNKWHYGKNEADVPAEIIVFYAGIEGIPITVKEPLESEVEKESLVHY